MIFAWVFCGSLGFLSDVKEAKALNKVNNWNFNGSSVGWTTINGMGTDTCGSISSLEQVNMATFSYNGNLDGQSAFEATTDAVKKTNYIGSIIQTMTAPGSGSVKVKGKFSYYANSLSWGSGWIRLDIFDSANSMFIAQLACITISGNRAWTTLSFGNTTLNGGTTYTVRATLGAATKANSNTAITLGVDDIVVNFAPTNLSAFAPPNTTNVELSWDVSSAGSGANGLHPTTPYKIYRNTSSPVTAENFLANSITNFYTDTTTVGDTAYYYVVSDLDTSGEESPLSSEVSVIANLLPPPPPTISSITNVTASSLRVNWTAPTGEVDSYKVERCERTSCTDFSTIASGITNLYYDDFWLEANTIYRYRILATNAAGDSPPSNAVEQLTLSTITNISSVYRWAWNDLIGWLDFYSTDTVMVSGDRLEGYADSSIGYIAFNCNSTPIGNVCGSPAGNWGVINDGNGNLSGWAWNDGIGWISLTCNHTSDGTSAPNNTNTCAIANYQVTIDSSTGDFSGWAWNDIIGWISLNCDNLGIGNTCAPPLGSGNSTYKVRTTTWRAGAVSSSLVSSVFDTGISGGVAINSISWKGSLNNGAVDFQLASSNCPNGATNPPPCDTGNWSYIGPDGTSDSYYSGSQNASIPINLKHHNNHRYLRYKIFLYSDVGQSQTPTVEDVIINYSP